MGEDKEYKLQYCLRVLPIRVLSSRAQNVLFRKIYDEFAKKLKGILLKKTSSKHYFGGHSVINESIDTTCGGVELEISNDNGFGIWFSSSPEIPKSKWRAGQMVHYALSAIEQYRITNSVELVNNEGRRVLDLVKIRINAALGNEKRNIAVGFIPRHYVNGAVIKSSDYAIKEIEQEVADELMLANSSGKITYETIIAYAWHRKHGVLPAFGSGTVPLGFEARVINSGIVTVRSGASNIGIPPVL